MVEAQDAKQQMLQMKRMVVASDAILKDFNWQLNMPLDQSQVVKSAHAVLDHKAPREVTVLKRDVRAPTFDMTFELMTDDQAREAQENSLSAAASGVALTTPPVHHKVTFNKVQLQQFFEELEKVQIKLDTLTN